MAVKAHRRLAEWCMHAWVSGASVQLVYLQAGMLALGNPTQRRKEKV